MAVIEFSDHQVRDGTWSPTALRQAYDFALLPAICQRNNTCLTAMALLCGSLFLAGCGGKYVGRGETSEFENKNIGVFLVAGEDKYRPVPDAVCGRLTEGLQWVTPHGVEVVEGTVKASCGDVTWSTGGNDYSARGVNIEARGRIRVEKDCPEGQYWLAVGLPVLTRVSLETGTVPVAAVWLWTPIVIGSTQKVMPASMVEIGDSKVLAIPVELLIVKATASRATAWKVGLAVFIIVVVVVVIVILGGNT